MIPLLEAPLSEFLLPKPLDADGLGFAYDDVEAVPLEPELEFPDGDDSIHGSAEPSTTAPLGLASPMIQAERVAKQRKPFLVVLPRTLEWKDTGRAVTAMQRGLRAAEFRRMVATGTYFMPTVRQVAAFKTAKKLPNRDGKVFGAQAHKAMLPYYDAYCGWLMAHDREALAERRRWVAVSTAFSLLHIAPRVHYTQGPMRMQIVRNRDRPPFDGDVWEDCSSLVTGCYWVAGIPDPNGYGYDGRTGWTGTLSAHGRRTDRPQPGDLGFYGRSPYSHVVIYVGRGRCISFGSEPGPYFLPFSYRGDFSHWRTYPMGA